MNEYILNEDVELHIHEFVKKPIRIYKIKNKLHEYEKNNTFCEIIRECSYDCCTCSCLIIFLTLIIITSLISLVSI